MALFFQFSLPTQRLCRRLQPLTLLINGGGLNVSLSASIHSVSGWQRDFWNRSQCKDTTSEGRFATFRATQFEINISREVKH